MNPRSLVEAVMEQQDRRLMVPEVTFAEALDVFHVSRFTGRVYIDFAEGKPKAVELSRPMFLKVVE